MKLKTNLNLRFDKASLQLAGSRIVRGLHDLPIIMFVQYGRFLHLLTVLAIAIVAVVLIWDLLYVDPAGVVDIPKAKPKLYTEGIDRLEFWIEEREAARQTSIVLPKRDFLEGGEI